VRVKESECVGVCVGVHGSSGDLLRITMCSL